MKKLINISVISLTVLGLVTSANAETKTKDLRLCLASNGKITAKSKCKFTEVPVDAAILGVLASGGKPTLGFSPTETTGTTGATGATGSTGATGAMGPVGPIGPQGNAGIAGAMGPIGPQGLKGDKGEKGDTGAQGVQGHQGVQGAQGPQGSQGAQGPVGISSWEMIKTERNIGANTTELANTWCTGGKKVIGGGVDVSRLPRKLQVNYSSPTLQNNAYGWTVGMQNPTTDTGTFHVYAICAYVN